MQIETIEAIEVKGNELIHAQEKINTGLVAFNNKKAELEALAKSAAEITINGIEDKEGYKLADQKRKELKAERVAITKDGKEMRAILTTVSKGIIEKENELVSIISSEEQRLVDEQNKIDAERERIKKEEEARKEAIIQDRINTLAGYGFQIDYSEIKSMDDSTFDQYKEAAKVQFEKAEAERLEAERLAAEQAEKERLEKEAEAKKLADERKELEELREKQAAAQRIIDEQNAKIEADRKAIEDEKLRIENEKKAAEEAKQREAELKKAREEAAEAARLQAIQDAKDAERAKKEKEEREAEEARLKAEQAPDRAKINLYVKSIQSLEVPVMKSTNGKKIMASIQELVGKLTSYSTEKANTL